MLTPDDENTEDIEKEAKKLLELLGDFEIEFRLNDEEAILFYIAGFCAASEVKNLTCESCTPLFAKSKNTPIYEFEEDLGDFGHMKEEFLNQINRGGLFTPSDAMYILVLFARQLNKKIFDKGEIQKYFFECKNQRAVFTACFELKLRSDDATAAILEQTCEKSHKFSEHIKSIGRRVFNTMSKNFCSEQASKIHESRKRKPKDPKESPAARKIMKLQHESK